MVNGIRKVFASQQSVDGNVLPWAWRYEMLEDGRELELIAILLEGYADQLTSGSDSGFGEKLLQGGFDGGLGNLQAIRDLLVGEAFEDEREDLFLAFG